MFQSGTLLSSVVQETVSTLEREMPWVQGAGARAGLSRPALRRVGASVPLASFTSMLESAAHDSGNPMLGVELGRKSSWSALGPVSELVRTAPTLGDGLRQFVRCFGSLQTRTKAELSVANGIARLSYAIADPTVRCRTQDAGFTLAIVQSMLSGLVGHAWTASGVDFEHAAAAEPGRYRRHFPCPARFGQRENALMFPAGLLNAALRDADPKRHAAVAAGLFDAMHHQTKVLDLTQSVEAWIASALCRADDTDIDCVARDFGFSTRSFQRRLAACGANYFDMRNRVRASIAQGMLTETDLTITSIALQLGYSETSAFSRSFKVQVGETPSEYRKKHELLAGSGSV